MHLTLAISTIGARVHALRLPEPCSDVSVLVLAQNFPGGELPWRNRPDVKLVPLTSNGLSHSRNAALDHVRSGFILFSDDDMVLDMEGILLLKQALAQNSDLALARGWRAERFKRCRSTLGKLHLLNATRICAPELMIRVQAFRQADIRFDSEFGVGARYGIGEDYVFVADALKAGLKARAVPVVTGAHPCPSTGDIWDNANLFVARRAVLQRVFGAWSPAVALAYAIKHRHHFPNLSATLRFAFGKARYQQ